MLQTTRTETTLPTANAKPLSRLRPWHARNATLVIVTVAVLLQLAIFFSIDNLIASGLLLCGLFSGLYYAADQQLLKQYPLSTLTIIGYTIWYFVVPPLGKLAIFQPIVKDLDHPILVWSYGIAGLLTVILAHYVYRRFSPYWTIRWTLAHSFFRPLHFFELPDEFQFWVLGFIGLAGTLAIVRFMPGSTISVRNSIARSFSPLIYCPYFVAFPNLVDPRYRSTRRLFRPGLVLYSILLILASIVANSRSFMVVGFVSIACVYVFRVFTGTIAPPRLGLKTLIAIFVCFWLLSGPLTNLAASMLITRGIRSQVSPEELARKTWKTYRSGIAVEAYEESVSRNMQAGRYKENYYDNIFLNRFGNMRFVDLAIDGANGAMAMGRESYLRALECRKILTILPDPLIKFLDLDIDKEALLSGSSQDYLNQMARGTPVGGMKFGSGLVVMRMTFGMMWPIAMGLIATVLFCIFDGSCDLSVLWNENNKRVNCVVFNPLVAATLFGYMFIFGETQDFTGFLTICTRSWVTMGIFYAVAFILSKFVSSMLFGWARRA